MTPDRRLDQIEPILADVAQKTDRLIESNGQILEIALRADSNAKLAAKGVADLTIEMRQRFERVDQRFDEQKADIDQQFQQVDQRFIEQKADIDQRFQQVDQRFAEQKADIDRRFAEQKGDIDQRFAEQKADIDRRFDQQQNQLDDLRQEMQKGFQDVNQKFGQFEQTQRTILTILLDRLK